jgi:hypothetical protein
MDGKISSLGEGGLRCSYTEPPRGVVLATLRHVAHTATTLQYTALRNGCDLNTATADYDHSGDDDSDSCQNQPGISLLYQGVSKKKE